jgi:hypothetical protein
MDREEFEKSYGINRGDLVWVVEERGEGVIFRSGIYILDSDDERNYSLVEVNGNVGEHAVSVERGSGDLGWYARVIDAEKVADFGDVRQIVGVALGELGNRGEEK